MEKIKGYTKNQFLRLPCDKANKIMTDLKFGEILTLQRWLKEEGYPLKELCGGVN